MFVDVDKCLILKLTDPTLLLLYTQPNFGFHISVSCLFSIKKIMWQFWLHSHSSSLLYLYILHLSFTQCLRCAAVLSWQCLDSLNYTFLIWPDRIAKAVNQKTGDGFPDEIYWKSIERFLSTVITQVVVEFWPIMVHKNTLQCHI